MGTGPYCFTEWVSGATIAFERFTNYWGTPAKTEKMTLKVIEETSTALIEAAAEIIHIFGDCLWEALATSYDEVKKAANLQLYPDQPIKYWVLIQIINSQRPPFNDPTEVADRDFGGTTTRGTLARRALLYAIDREKIVEEVYRGHAEVPNCTLASPSWPSYNASIEAHPYDPEKAREIL